MRILYIWDADYPWDVRVEKICDSLNKFGNEVHIIARNLKKTNQYELINGLHVHRIAAWQNNKLNYVISFPAFFSPIWNKMIKNVIEKYNIDLIIVRDLPLAIAGIWASKKYNIPIIFDMAEDYVEMIREIWKINKYRGFNLIVRNPYLALMVEKYALNNFDHIFVVIEEAMNILNKKGIDSSKITIINNTPVLGRIKYNHVGGDTKKIEFINNRFSVIYTGGITFDRGISVLINAIPQIVEEIPDFLFVIIGKGPATEYYLDLIKQKKIQEYINWIGWIQHEEIYDFICASKIGIIPHFVSNHTNTTIPNKIYDYMACGIPVLASDTIPMQRIIHEEKCGIIFKSGNSDDLVRAIKEIKDNIFQYGKNGVEAVDKKYNWGYEESKIKIVIDYFRARRRDSAMAGGTDH